MVQAQWECSVAGLVPPGGVITAAAHVVELDGIALAFSTGELFLLHTSDQSLEEVHSAVLIRHSCCI